MTWRSNTPIPHTGRARDGHHDSVGLQMLRPGIHTKAHRQVNSAVYHVFEGRGATIIAGVRFDWEQGDIFVIPSWAYHEHLNASKSERAILFSVQDTPVLVRPANIARKRWSPTAGMQEIKDVFSAEKVLAHR